MSPSRTAAYLVAAVLFAAWLASAAGISRRPRINFVTSRPSSQVEGVEALAADVQSQAARLKQRIATAPAPQAPARNPFSFADPSPTPRPSRMQRRAEAIGSPPLANPEPPEPELTLLGVAEQQTPDGVVRTALLGGRGEELFMVVAGQNLAGRYRVVAVGADAVELKDELTGLTRRLTLKSPV